MNSKFKYTWDETKNKSNHVKHGVRFEEIEAFDWESADVIYDERHSEENRYIAIGPIGDRLYVMVFTDRPPDTIHFTHCPNIFSPPVFEPWRQPCKNERHSLLSPSFLLLLSA